MPSAIVVEPERPCASAIVTGSDREPEEMCEATVVLKVKAPLP